jgi:hypothetical protein
MGTPVKWSSYRCPPSKPSMGFDILRDVMGLLVRANGDLLRFSDRFPDANVLLAECSRRHLEGIAGQRKQPAYRSGTRGGWVNVKTAERKAANRCRGKLFEKAQDRAG